MKSVGKSAFDLIAAAGWSPRDFLADLAPRFPPRMHLFDEAEEPSDEITEVESTEVDSGSRLAVLVLSGLSSLLISSSWQLLHLRARLSTVTKPLIMKKVFTARVALSRA